jgi:hypothetical protein
MWPDNTKYNGKWKKG